MLITDTKPRYLHSFYSNASSNVHASPTEKLIFARNSKNASFGQFDKKKKISIKICRFSWLDGVLKQIKLNLYSDALYV